MSDDSTILRKQAPDFEIRILRIVMVEDLAL